MQNVLVIGSLNMDIVLSMDKIPTIGETVLGDSLHYNCGGKGANQAYAASSLGGNVVMLGYVGNDAFGKALVGNLASVGVDVGRVGHSSTLETGTAIICVEKTGNNTIVVVPGANNACDETYLRANDAAFQWSDYILLQMEIPLEAVCYAIARGKALGKTVILNPAPAPTSLPEIILKSVDYIIPNETELARLCGDTTGVILEDARRLILAGASSVIVTLGQQGSWLVQSLSNEHFPAIPVQAVDTTAAGDCFCAAFVVAVANNKSPSQAIAFANIAAGLSVTKPGAQSSIPTQADVGAWDARLVEPTN